MAVLLLNRISSIYSYSRMKGSLSAGFAQAVNTLKNRSSFTPELGCKRKVIKGAAAAAPSARTCFLHHHSDELKASQKDGKIVSLSARS